MASAVTKPSSSKVNKEATVLRTAWAKFRSAKCLPARTPIPAFHRWFCCRLQRFYSVHNPAQIEKVDSILEKYAGNHALLFRSLYKKYAVDPEDFEV